MTANDKQTKRARGLRIYLVTYGLCALLLVMSGYKAARAECSYQSQFLLQDGKTATMEIRFLGEGVHWEINGKLFKNVEYESLTSKFPRTEPFACLYTPDGEYEHVFCGFFHEKTVLNELIGMYTVIISQRNAHDNDSEDLYFRLFSSPIAPEGTLHEAFISCDNRKQQCWKSIHMVLVDPESEHR